VDEELAMFRVRTLILGFLFALTACFVAQTFMPTLDSYAAKKKAPPPERVSRLEEIVNESTEENLPWAQGLEQHVSDLEEVVNSYTGTDLPHARGLEQRVSDLWDVVHSELWSPES
jgi:hypothetical protein